MPGPTTEAVNDDVQERRGDLHRVEVNLTAEIGRVSNSLTAEIGRVSNTLTAEIGRVSNTLTAEIGSVSGAQTAELGRVSSAQTAELGRVSSSLTAEIGRVSNSVARLEGEFAAFKWMLGATLGLMISGVVATVWGAGETSVKLEGLNGRIDRIEASINRLIERQEQGRRPEPTPR